MSSADLIQGESRSAQPRAHTKESSGSDARVVTPRVVTKRLLPLSLLALVVIGCGPSESECLRERAYLTYQAVEVRPDWLTPEMIEEHEERCGEVLGLDSEQDGEGR